MWQKERDTVSVPFPGIRMSREYSYLIRYGLVINILQIWQSIENGGSDGRVNAGDKEGRIEKKNPGMMKSKYRNNVVEHSADKGETAMVEGEGGMEA